MKKIVGDPDLATIMNEELLLLRQKVLYIYLELTWSFFKCSFCFAVGV